MKHSQGISVFVSAVILSLGVAVQLTDVKPQNQVEKQILQFFSKWRSGSTLPFTLPPLDVITVPPLNGSYSGKGIKVHYSSSEMRLVGVNNFTVVELSVALQTFSASGALFIPTLSITAEDYELQGKAFYVYTLKGSGKLNVTLNNIKLRFKIRLTRSGNRTKVNEMQLDFTIENIQANLENSSWPVNKLLNKEGVKILSGHYEEIITATRANLVEKFDQYLANVTPVELLNKIQKR